MIDIATIPLKDWLEWSGSVISLIGAFLLAININCSRYGWLAFLVANFVMIGWGVTIHAHGLVVQQLGFTITSLIGLHRTGLLSIPMYKVAPLGAGNDQPAPNPIAWFVEYDELIAPGEWEHVSHVLYEKPDGHYLDCSTPITSKQELERALKVPHRLAIRNG
ncbi:hypothetical protein [Limnohabitans sp. TEGF004]|uniref:hypothetical protein n=1 Tax=Limnohabitans sp. TEGF004 TaxID=2986281 RepID=UPI002493BC72|nr:hypothetical protein [Limnohabitans sp. TEGF004]